ncbi:MAG: flagellar biosynthesis protein FlhB [Hydrogenibacillus sp.]|nr:flagellar biosynthesis protein FlhB [Hydrogenibacillus sp.]
MTESERMGVRPAIRRYPVALQFFAEEKTEPATPYKKREARKRGQVARSLEVSQALVLFAGTLILWLLGNRIKVQLLDVFRRASEQAPGMPLDVDGVYATFTDVFGGVWPWMFIVFGAFWLAAFFGQYVQIGSLLSVEPLVPKLSRINPISGLKRMFGLRALVDLGKALFKFVLTGAVLIVLLRGEMPRLAVLTRLSPSQVAQAVSGIVLKLLFAVALLSLVIAAFDYAFQRFEYGRNLRMTKQEVKDEWKKTEGDPLVKSRQRRRRRELALRRMMLEVPSADVVITNPTHVAVALRYDALRDEAPRVVAKGLDFMALRIRTVAERSGVTIVENPPLARALYRDVPIGGTVPPAFFRAVAEVLAFVYRKEGRTFGARSGDRR